MRVKATLSRTEEVTLSDLEVTRIVKKYLCQKLNLPEVFFVKDGKLIEEWEARGGSYGWWENKEVRDATEVDEAAKLILDTLGI